MLSAVSDSAPESARISRLARRVLSAHNEELWKDRIRAIFLSCAEELAPVAAGLYQLHLDTGSLQLDYKHGRTANFADAIAASGMSNANPVSHAVATAALNGKAFADGGVVAVPIRRGETCLFVLVMLHPRDPGSWIDVQHILATLKPAYVARRVGRLLEHSRARLDYRAGWTDFMNQLGDVVLTSSGFRFAALRERRGNRLDCLAAWGFPKSLELRDLSWARERYEAFRLASEGLTQPVRDLTASDAREIAQREGLDQVRGFIAVPVRAGQETFGVLSLATSVPYDLAPAEIAALESLGNTVGLAIVHYRNPSGPSPSLSTLTDFSVRTSLEVIAASARHEGVIHIDNAIDLLGKLQETKNTDALGGQVTDQRVAHFGRLPAAK